MWSVDAVPHPNDLPDQPTCHIGRLQRQAEGERGKIDRQTDRWMGDQLHGVKSSTTTLNATTSSSI